MKQLVLTLFLLTFPAIAFAQAPEGEEEEGKKDYSLLAFQLGPMLPNQIEGVTEIMPFWTLNYGFPFRKGTMEIGGGASKANGITYYIASLGLRGEVRLEDLIGHFYAGLSSHYHYPLNSAPPILNGGGHVGGGLMTLLGDNTYFRADMKFLVNPGTALYIGFGFEFRMPGGGESGPGEGEG